MGVADAKLKKEQQQHKQQPIFIFETACDAPPNISNQEKIYVFCEASLGMIEAISLSDMAWLFIHTNLVL